MGRRTVRGVEIKTIAMGGEGLGYLPDGRVIFVQGALPGDVVEAKITRQKKSWARGKVERLEEESPHRVESGCDAFSRGCGGCQFWNTTYEQELLWKSDVAFEVMKRISKLALPEPKVVGAPSAANYRTKVVFHQKVVRGEVFRGFFATGTNRVVPIRQCPIADPLINDVLGGFGSALDLLGRAEITVETAGEGQVVVRAKREESAPLSKEILARIKAAQQEISLVKGVEFVEQSGKKSVIGECAVAATEVLASPPVSSLTLGAGQFRQANRALNKELVAFVQEAVESRAESGRILELFCGAGNFSFPLARAARSLLGVEGSRQAIEHAQAQAARFDGRAQVEFRVGDLSDEELIRELLQEPFDSLVLDPPRRGAPEVAKQLESAKQGELIVYISCDIACLARDLSRIAVGGWEVEELAFFDMFPRTAHLEAVAVLRRQGINKD